MGSIPGQGTEISQWCSTACTYCCLVAKSCKPFLDPRDCSPPGPGSMGFSRQEVLECVAISFSRGSSQPRDWTGVPASAGRLSPNHQGSPSLHIHTACKCYQDLPGGTLAKRCKRHSFDPWVRKIPWRAWQPTPVFLSGEFHEQRSLAGSIP